MKKSKLFKPAISLLMAVSIIGFSACSTKSKSTSIVYGKVTAISGNKVTIALGTMKQQGENQNNNASGSGNPPQGTPPSGQPGNNSSTGSNSTSGGNNTTQGTSQNGSPSNGSNTTSGSNNNTQGNPPSGQPGGAPDMLTLTGESKTITISDTGIITKQSMAGIGGQAQNGQSSTNTTGNNTANSNANSTSNNTSASLSDITVGSILKITYKTNIENLVSVEIMGSAGGNSANGAVGSGDTTEVTGTGFYTLNSGSATKSNETLTASEKDQSAAIVSNGANLTLSNMKIATSGNSSSMDSSSFYGLNAAVLAKTNSKISISNTTINTTGTGANGVFACGNGASIDLNNVTINCKASGAHGVDATVAGVLTMKNVNITTAGDGAAAAIATDRGGGTITATGGTVITTGTKSPAIYSTGNITVSDAKLQSSASEVAVIEGKNSITVNNCNMSTDKNYGVFIYQSMSGDASVGCGTFTMNGGSLTANEGPMFYSTNTTGVINLKNAALTCKSGVLLKAGADQWGNSGSNGSAITLNADTQNLKGDVVLDNISTAVLTLKNNSTLQGTINTAKTAKSVSLTLDQLSTWNVTADSYLTSLTDADTALKNIISNGHTVYYDSTNSANSWLGGKTINLTGGGQLTPSK
jgi:hypothetical protein